LLETKLSGCEVKEGPLFNMCD